MATQDFYIIKEGGVELHIRLSPSASANKIEGIYPAEEGARLKVSVTSVPEKGKANKSLIQLLSKTFKVSKGQIQITSGEIHRNKTVFIENFPLHKLESLLHKEGLPHD